MLYDATLKYFVVFFPFVWQKKHRYVKRALNVIVFNYQIS